MPAITDQDGDVAQVVNGALVVTGSGFAAPPLELKILDAAGVNKAAVDASGRLSVNDTNQQALDDARRFSRILKFEPNVGEEIRRDETVTDDYHGVAADGTSTIAASWSVVRFYKTVGLITRVRYRTGVAWDSRTLGWT